MVDQLVHLDIAVATVEDLEVLNPLVDGVPVELVQLNKLLVHIVVHSVLVVMVLMLMVAMLVPVAVAGMAAVDLTLMVQLMMTVVVVVVQVSP